MSPRLKPVPEISPERCFEVARMLLRGLSDSEIANRLGMPRQSVKAGMARLFREFQIPGPRKRVQLAVKLSQFPIFTE